ncbi:uncharacterized protein LOC115626350 [Scaptodrosophila lebanonensis]|uniref:Uncharacterized protein LOC115626350 n=1 Tax=Drosophila lebanonensis TaxID=7225 RepID=A0A6J2TNE1_DROLE|nr:uncharacterized protein LOC115626350 [Scaptodrosophila lebanonensis]XP_030377559.1 uncharacterized protein LOC115626350 [Scaptodrosophila lebanonensis]
MDYEAYFQKQLEIFHYHLRSDYGLFIRVATCIAFGALCGWFMGFVTWIVYKLAVRLGGVPLTHYRYPEDDDLELEDECDCECKMKNSKVCQHV